MKTLFLFLLLISTCLLHGQTQEPNGKPNDRLVGGEWYSLADIDSANVIEFIPEGSMKLGWTQDSMSGRSFLVYLDTISRAWRRVSDWNDFFNVPSGINADTLANNEIQQLVDNPTGQIGITNPYNPTAPIQYLSVNDGDFDPDNERINIAPYVVGIDTVGLIFEDTRGILYNDTIEYVSGSGGVPVNSPFDEITETINSVPTEIIKASNPQANFLFGSPTTSLDNLSPSMLNDWNRFFYFDKLRSHFSAGRHNNLADTIPQWRIDKLAQYSASFGWDQFCYGGNNTTNGDTKKGQFSSGYSNRGFAGYAQTLGFQNANGSLGGMMGGSENFTGRTLVDASYNINTKTFAIAGNVTAVFVPGEFIGVRAYDAANQFYTVSSGEIISSTFSDSTYIVAEHTNWFGFAFTDCQVFKMDLSSEAKHVSNIGYRNLSENNERSGFWGNEHESEDRHGAFHIGSKTKSELNSSLTIGSENYGNAGDNQVYILVPNVTTVASTVRRATLSGKNNTATTLMQLPPEFSWYMTITGILENETTDAVYSVTGSVLMHRILGSPAVIDSQSITNSGAYTINAQLYGSGTTLAIECNTPDELIGTYEIKIIQVKK